METKKAILSSAVLVAALATGSIKATNLFDFSSLGSGSEVRSTLLSSPEKAFKAFDLNCGDKKDATKAADAKCGDKKAKDAKCGDKKAKDAKCGDKKAKDAKCGDSKSKDAKCGDKKAK